MVVAGPRCKFIFTFSSFPRFIDGDLLILLVIIDSLVIIV
jgi:hypothetical protein